MQRYDIRFDIDAKSPPYFWVADAAIRKVKGDRYIPLSRLLVLDTHHDEDQKALQELAKAIKYQGLCDGMDAMEVYTRLDRVRKIRDKDVVTVTIEHDLEEVVEIFSRLNSRGTRVTEADIYLGVVAARSPGWVRDTFLPYLRALAQAGFDIDPNLLFRTLTAVGAKRVRFKQIHDDFWNAHSIQPHWKRTTKAWERLVQRMREHGILSNDVLPTEAALVTSVALLDKFPDERVEQTLYWLLQASRFGRYSGGATTALDEDLRDVDEAGTLPEALRRLLRRLRHEEPLTADDFLRDYGDARFGRFLLYLLAYHNKAQDWDASGQRLGFEGLEVLSDFRPQWHHIFPRGYLEGKVPDHAIDALANIAVIGPGINIRISAKQPMDYIRRYGVTREKLAQQWIDEDIMQVTAEQYQDWLQRRAERLAEAGNAYLQGLRGEL